MIFLLARTNPLQSIGPILVMRNTAGDGVFPPQFIVTVAWYMTDDDGNNGALYDTDLLHIGDKLDIDPADPTLRWAPYPAHLDSPDPLDMGLTHEEMTDERADILACYYGSSICDTSEAIDRLEEIAATHIEDPDETGEIADVLVKLNEQQQREVMSKIEVEARTLVWEWTCPVCQQLNINDDDAIDTIECEACRQRYVAIFS